MSKQSPGGTKSESPSEKAVLGSTGYQPVPSGNLPDATGAASMNNPGAGFQGDTRGHSGRQVADRSGQVARATHFQTGSEVSPSGAGTGGCRETQVSKARHDLRSPLGHILGFSEMLLEEARALGLQQYVSAFEMINDTANELIAEVNQYLDWQKIEANAEEVGRLKHQLRSKAGRIVTTADLLSELSRTWKDDVFRQDLARISTAANKLNTLADTALEFVTHHPAGSGDPGVADVAPRASLQCAVTGDPSAQLNQGSSILVVDDLEENQELLRRRLSRLGYAVQIVANGRQALEFLATRSVDLILLDIIMPELDGFQTLASLKQSPVTRPIPVIMLSSSDEAATVVHCMQLGADDFLPKPFNTTLLIARIESALAKKRLREMDRAATAYYFDKGTLSPNAPSYVERQADKELPQHLLQSEFCYVLTSRQMGKSSLMVRTAHNLREHGVNVAVLDLAAIGLNVTPEQWYDGLCIRIGRQLRLEDELDSFWLSQGRLGPVQRFFTALRDVAMEQRQRPLVVFVDELDTVRSLPFSTDEFFAAIRECYNRRTEDAGFERLTFCLLGVATPGDLIRDSRVTPFNIGKRIELADFTRSDATQLARGLGRKEPVAEALLDRVFHWTGGHPYLTQRFCKGLVEFPEVATREDADRLCQRLFLSSRAREEDDNLLFVQKVLLNSEVDHADLLALYDRLRHHRGSVRYDETNRLMAVLRLSGIVKLVEGCLTVRNRIYRHVFDRAWIRALRGGR